MSGTHSSSQEVLVVPKASTRPFVVAGVKHQAPGGQGAPRAPAEHASGGSHPYQSDADLKEETGAAGSRSRASGISRAGQSAQESALGTVRPSA